MTNIREAIQGYLESLRAHLRAHDDPLPPSISEEIVEIAMRARYRFCLASNW